MYSTKHRLRSGFRTFANWAFSPEGITSLDIIVFGDFAHGGWASADNVLLMRSTVGRSNFRVVFANNGEWKDALDKYHVSMGACPVEHLFRC